MFLKYIPTFLELSKHAENAGLSSKFANDCDVRTENWFLFGEASLKKSNLFGDDVFKSCVMLLLGICKYIFMCKWIL